MVSIEVLTHYTPETRNLAPLWFSQPFTTRNPNHSAGGKQCDGGGWWLWWREKENEHRQKRRQRAVEQQQQFRKQNWAAVQPDMKPQTSARPKLPRLASKRIL
uniref:Uncharacterized protein n=1 Tax=Opuntia streptacantha TaxID=393608 RepID=A0A7C9A7C9_OPUST